MPSLEITRNQSMWVKANGRSASIDGKLFTTVTFSSIEGKPVNCYLFL